MVPLIRVSFVPYVDWAAHLGGLIGGALTACIVFGRHLSSPRAGLFVQIAGFIGLVAFLAGGFVLLATVTKPTRDLIHFCDNYRNHLKDQSIPC